MGRFSSKRRRERFKLYKLTAAGNDFLLFYGVCQPVSFYRRLARQCCLRRYAWGADGLLVVEKKERNFRMRIFNPDGSEAEMCGNGARCVALWIYLYKKRESNLTFLTKAGEIKAVVTKVYRPLRQCVFSKANIRIKMTSPTDLKLHFSLPLSPRSLSLSFINSGVPHAVIFVEGLERIDIERLGALVRYHKHFAPAGTNVDFVEFIKDDFIKIRTYERGIEKETLACGTGIVASAILSKLRYSSPKLTNRVKVLTRSGETLEVSFNYQDNIISNVWLKGSAYLVGEIIT